MQGKILNDLQLIFILSLKNKIKYIFYGLKHRLKKNQKIFF